MNSRPIPDVGTIERKTFFAVFPRWCKPTRNWVWLADVVLVCEVNTERKFDWDLDRWVDEPRWISWYEMSPEEAAP